MGTQTAALLRNSFPGCSLPQSDRLAPDLADRGEIDPPLLQVCERPVFQILSETFFLSNAPAQQPNRDGRQKWVLNKALSSPLLVLPDSQVEKNAIAAPSLLLLLAAPPLGGTEQKTPSRRWLRRGNTKKGSKGITSATERDRESEVFSANPTRPNPTTSHE